MIGVCKPAVKNDEQIKVTNISLASSNGGSLNLIRKQEVLKFFNSESQRTFKQSKCIPQF